MGVSIKTDKEGLEITWKDGQATIRWEAIQRVEAFKRDLITYDLICLHILCADSSQNVELNEEMDGDAQFEQKLAVYLPDLERDWWHKVAVPAFKTNRTIIFDRSRRISDG